MLKIEKVSAHCDVPCGIYDPARAIVAAQSVIRMVDLINAKMENKSDNEAQDHNDLSRYIATKEEEAMLCKEEIRIIWGDYIKPPHVEQHPDVHVIAHKIMMLGGAVKQHVSRAKAEELLAEVNKFAEIFWATKGIETKVVKSPSAPNEDMVIPVL